MPKLPPTKCVSTRIFARGMPSRCGDGQLGGAHAHGRVVERQPVAVPHGRGRRAARSGCGGWRPSGTSPSMRTSASAEPALPRRRARCAPGIKPPNSFSGSVAVSRPSVDGGDRGRRARSSTRTSAGRVLRALQAVGDHDRDRLAGVVDRRRPASGRSSDPGAGPPTSEGRRCGSPAILGRFSCVSTATTPSAASASPTSMRADPAARNRRADERGVREAGELDLAGVAAPYR